MYFMHSQLLLEYMLTPLMMIGDCTDYLDRLIKLRYGWWTAHRGGCANYIDIEYQIEATVVI